MEVYFKENYNYFKNRRVPNHEKNTNNALMFSVVNELIPSSILLKFSKAICEYEKTNLIVLPHVKQTNNYRRLLKSFIPKLIVVHFRTGVYVFFKSIYKIFKKLLHIKTKESLLKLAIGNVKIGHHIYDYILRKRNLPKINKVDFKSKLLILYSLYLYYLIDYLCVKNNISIAISLDNVYLEGILYEYAKQNKIILYAGFDINNLTLHIYKKEESFNEHCRTPDFDVLQFVVNSRYIKKEVDRFIVKRYSGEQNQHDAKRAFDANKLKVDREYLISKMGLKAEKLLILVLPHIFCDAPHAYPSTIFSDYFDWFVQTLDFLIKSEKYNILVKEHPSSELYNEKGLVNKIINDFGMNNSVYLLDGDINSFSLMKSVDAIITCGGTAGIEYPSMGVPSILAASPPYSKFEFVNTFTTLKEYKKCLENIEFLEKPSKSNQHLAKCFLFYSNNVQGIDKNKKIFGEYHINLGEDADSLIYFKSIDSFNSINQSHLIILKHIKFMHFNKFKNLNKISFLSKIHAN